MLKFEVPKLTKKKKNAQKICGSVEVDKKKCLRN